MKKVLLWVNHRKDRSPGQRYRIEQYLEYMEQNGYEFKFSNILDERTDALFYTGSVLDKAKVILRSFFIRLKDLMEVRKYDAVYVYREAFVLRGVFFERMVTWLGVKLVFDFDDSIWLANISAENQKFSFLKNPLKTNTLIRLSDMTTVGNKYLKAYADQYGDHVVVLPTTINMKDYQLEKSLNKEGQVCIGWTGSPTTIPHFELIEDVLLALKEKYKDQVYYKVIGDPNYTNEKLGVQGMPWSSETEALDLSELDIGIMPLENDEWSQGKCACKGLQYMALGIPAVLSPVGINSDIITPNENGFLAETKEEWLDVLSQLIDDLSLRKRIGEKGRETVQNHFSSDVIKHDYLKYFNELIDK